MKDDRYEDHVVEVTDYRNEVGDQVDGKHQISKKQPYGQSSQTWNVAVSSESSDQAQCVGNHPDRITPTGGV